MALADGSVAVTTALLWLTSNGRVVTKPLTLIWGFD